MKRFVPLLLLAVLPLQMTWAAGVSPCPNERRGEVHASAHGEVHHAASAHAHDSDNGDEGHAAGADLHCSVFHFVALEPTAAPVQTLPQTRSSAQDVERVDYESHIPDGLDRPNWRFAA
jgi:hypothetical protein